MLILAISEICLRQQYFKDVILRKKVLLYLNHDLLLEVDLKMSFEMAVAMEIELLSKAIRL